MNPQGQQNNPFMSTIMGMRNKPGGQSMTPGNNPMLQGAIQQKAPQPQAAQNPLAAMAAPGMTGGAGGGGAAAKAMMPSNTPGANPGSTDALIKALGAMNQVITSTDDQQEIQDARKIILIIQQMIQRDQQKQGSKESALGQAQQGVGQFPQALQAPGGLGAGAPGPGTPPPSQPPGQAGQ